MGILKSPLPRDLLTLEDALNYRIEGTQTNKQLYTSRICKPRPAVLNRVLKVILGCFFALIVIHYHIYKLILKILSPVNSALKWTNYTPLVLVQNQMILKCRLVTD